MRGRGPPVTRKLDVCPLCCVTYKMYEKKRDRLLFRAQSKVMKIELLKENKPAHEWTLADFASLIEIYFDYENGDGDIVIPPPALSSQLDSRKHSRGKIEICVSPNLQSEERLH